MTLPLILHVSVQKSYNQKILTHLKILNNEVERKVSEYNSVSIPMTLTGFPLHKLPCTVVDAHKLVNASLGCSHGSNGTSRTLSINMSLITQGLLLQLPQFIRQSKTKKCAVEYVDMDGIPLENRWTEMGSDSSHCVVTHMVL